MRTLFAAGIALAIAFTLSCSAYFDEVSVKPCGDKYYGSGSDLLCEDNKTIVTAQRCYTGGDRQLYNPAKQFCQESSDDYKGYGAIKDLCGTSTYTANQRCGTGNAIENKCDKDWYAPSGTQYCKNGNAITSYGSVTLNGKTYKTMQIGNQTWMAENLNYNVSGSICYDNDPVNCDKYGRLYDFETAVDYDSYGYYEQITECYEDEGEQHCETSDGEYRNNYSEHDIHQGICPDGWHIPSNSEWQKLIELAGGTSGNSKTGSNLRAINGWKSYEGQTSEDVYGFTALPGGKGNSVDYFSYEGSEGNWWGDNGSAMNIKYDQNYVWFNSDISEENFLSIRCIKDN
ncbi:MAG: hypothetical protein LBH25_00495 [Fibromonadaceae bacterium]|jgi:uncharacterized protein (TIGR02145 family)|nr:hypothetical protein [Fibromonadaceae bacterium]